MCFDIGPVLYALCFRVSTHPAEEVVAGVESGMCAFLPSRAGGAPSTEFSVWKLLAYEGFLLACLSAFDVLWTLEKVEKELPFPPEDIVWL